MRILLLFFTFLITLNTTAANFEDDALEVVQEGLIVTVVNFEEGDKIKLFELETGVHILSKTIDQVDLSLLPIGKYLLENSQGKSAVIEKTDLEIIIEESLGTDFIVDTDSEFTSYNEVNIGEELENYYAPSESNELLIARDGDLITVVDFEEGDKIKLFEVKNKVHVLSKTTGKIDLSQLASGRYLIEDNHGKFIQIEKEEEVTTYVAAF
ncbi:hypothetical protein GCM10022393_30580 [Aquimarina addita]|uniref:T9SS C-terminal target domain-containing protein n=1 Tax=Aquimarina addita TaxID=870485 RepID=A0ABP6UNX3_9FLAO